MDVVGIHNQEYEVGNSHLVTHRLTGRSNPVIVPGCFVVNGFFGLFVVVFS